MKKFLNIIQISILTLGLGLLHSCSKDFLDLKPTTSIEGKDVFKSIVTAESALIGAYDGLSTYNFEGLYLPIMSDIIGEDVMVNSVDNWNWFVVVYQLDLLPTYTYPTNPWFAGYKVIFDANQIIANAASIPDASAEEIANLEGQAKVVRAFATLRLVQMYAPSYLSNPQAEGIMLVTQPVPALGDDFPRASVEDVYNQIVADLMAAIELLDEDDDKGFFDKRGAQAVLARAYLDMGEWEKARDMAVAAHTDLELMSVDELVFSGFAYRNSETIFTVAYTPDDNNVFLSLPSFYWPVAGYSSMRANDLFVDMFETTDLRRNMFVMDETIDADRNLILKFGHMQSVGNAERISIRASEMVLIEAECEAELGNYGAAQDALHRIQVRADLSVSKSNKTGQELIDEVLIERRKELFGEGFRWNDIKRRNLPFKREGDHWVKFDFNSSDADYYRLTFPIPQSELDRNDQINDANQNIGY